MHLLFTVWHGRGIRSMECSLAGCLTLLEIMDILGIYLNFFYWKSWSSTGILPGFMEILCAMAFVAIDRMQRWMSMRFFL